MVCQRNLFLVRFPPAACCLPLPPSASATVCLLLPVASVVGAIKRPPPEPTPDALSISSSSSRGSSCDEIQTQCQSCSHFTPVAGLAKTKHNNSSGKKANSGCLARRCEKQCEAGRDGNATDQRWQVHCKKTAVPEDFRCRQQLPVLTHIFSLCSSWTCFFEGAARVAIDCQRVLHCCRRRRRRLMHSLAGESSRAKPSQAKRCHAMASDGVDG